MNPIIPTHSTELQSLVTESGDLRLQLVEAVVPPLGSNEVLVRVEASPLNPSDQGLMFAAADPATGTLSGSSERPLFTARIPRERMGSIQGRIGQPMVVGNEGAGTVVAAGETAAAKSLLGRRVAVFGSGLYAEYRSVNVEQCMPLPDDTPFAAAASCFINPLTALGMVETLRIESHTALVHTAAASNLGQMLVRICQEDGIELVTVVRSAEQEALLRSMGVRHICDMSSAGFDQALRDAIAMTGATLAFDAIGGGGLARQILSAMERAIAARASAPYSRYGSTVHKQLYIYGSLDTGPTTFHRSFGLAWGIGGWLLWPFLKRIGTERTNELTSRIVAGLGSTFRSQYAGTLSLVDVLDPATIARYTKRSTGFKYLITPHNGEGPGH